MADVFNAAKRRNICVSPICSAPACTIRGGFQVSLAKPKILAILYLASSKITHAPLLIRYPEQWDFHKEYGPFMFFCFEP